MKLSTPEFCKSYYVNRQHTNSVKWDLPMIQSADPDRIPLWVADMDFQMPEAVREALIRRVEHGVFGYSMIPDAYYQTVGAWHERHFGYFPKKSWIRFSPGVVPALYWLITALTEPEDSVMILTPVYFPFRDAVNDTGRTLITSPLVSDKNGRYEMDLQDIEDKIKTHQVKLLIHCSPHNPVGRVWSAEELEALFSLCETYDVRIASDEIHQDIIPGARPFLSAATIGDGKYRNRLIILNSASKTFNLAGLGLAHTIIADPQLRRRYDAATQSFAHSAPNILGMLATQTAYEKGEDWMQSLLTVIRENDAYLRKTLLEALPKLVISPLEGTYLAWIDMRAYLRPDQLKEFFDKTCRLTVHYGELFGDGGSGFVRLNLATHPELIRSACQRITEHLSK